MPGRSRGQRKVLIRVLPEAAKNSRNYEWNMLFVVVGLPFKNSDNQKVFGDVKDTRRK